MSKNWSINHEVILTCASIPSGLFSLIASCTIIIMIFRSPTRLNRPFRRLIFGLSIYDISSSLAAIASAFPSPKGTRWGAIGNDGTCTAQAIFLQLGTLGSPLYNFALAVYYLGIIKLNLTPTQFRQRFEIYLHVVSNIYVWFSVVFLSVEGSFNFTRANCWIGPKPIDCVVNPEVDCISGANAPLHQWVFAGTPILFSFLGNIVSIFVLIWDIIRLKRKLRNLAMRSGSWRPQAVPIQSNADSSNANVNGRATYSMFRRLSSQLSLLSPRSARTGTGQGQQNRDPSSNENQSRTPQSHEVADGYSRRGSVSFTLPGRSTRSVTNRYNMKRDLMVQAVLYSTAFVFVYLFSYIYRIAGQINGEGKVHFVIVLLARILQPLQGVFNILIYTRISVMRLYRNSEFSWIQSFWVVISSGFDQDDISRRSRNSMVTAATVAAAAAAENNFVAAGRASADELPVSPRSIGRRRSSRVSVQMPVKTSLYSSIPLPHNSVNSLYDDDSFHNIDNVESDDDSFVKDEELCNIRCDNGSHDSNMLQKGDDDEEEENNCDYLNLIQAECEKKNYSFPEGMNCELEMNKVLASAKENEIGSEKTLESLS